MIKIIFSVALLFFGLLLANYELSSVEAGKTIRINVSFGETPSTNPLWIKVTAENIGGESQWTDWVDAHKFGSSVFNLHMKEHDGGQAKICIERYNFYDPYRPNPNCTTITTDKWVHDVNLGIPCNNDCKIEDMPRGAQGGGGGIKIPPISEWFD